MQIKQNILINNRYIKPKLSEKNYINSTCKIPIVVNSKSIFNIRKIIGHFFSEKNNYLPVSSDIWV